MSIPPTNPEAPNRYINDILPNSVIIPPTPKFGMGGRVAHNLWKEWAETLPFYTSDMSWVQFQVAFIQAQIQAMRHEAARLSLDPVFACACGCDSVRIVVERLDGSSLVPSEAQPLIQSITDYPWIYQVPQRIKEKCCNK